MFALLIGCQAVGGCQSTAPFAAMASRVAYASLGGPRLPSEQLAELQEVNSYVNGAIREVSDLEHYGQEDVWRIPTDGKGDCEDFALMKRQLLLNRGWPTSALTVLVGTSAQGEAHAVLKVATRDGDYILDNLQPWVVPAARSGFTAHSRQTSHGFVSEATGQVSAAPRAEFLLGPVEGRLVRRTAAAE